MKHLLILISILLLSSPVIGDNHTLPVRGEKGETLYGWGKYPEIVWKGFGDKDIHPKYKGDVVSSKPNGLGILTYPWGTKYVGEWKDGRFWNGIGYDKNRKIKYKYVNGVKQ